MNSIASVRRAKLVAPLKAAPLASPSRPSIPGGTLVPQLLVCKGLKTAALAVGDNGGGSPQEVALSGTGTE